MNAYIAIDPGVSGAIAFLSNTGVERYLEVNDMPTFKVKRGKSEKREVDTAALAGMLRKYIHAPIGMALIEMAGCRPGQSVSAVHANGRNWGNAHGVLVALGYPVQIVTPQAWKKALGVPAAKDDARKKASQLMPAFAHLWCRAKDDGRAEATLIALYAMKLHNQQRGLS